MKLKVLNSHVTSGPESFGEASLSAKLVNGIFFSICLIQQEIAHECDRSLLIRAAV